MPEKTLIIIIDALGFDLLEQAATSLNLKNRPIRLIPPYGFGEASLIWSGELPNKTGRWNEFIYNPKRSPFRWTRFLPLKPFDMLSNKYSFNMMFVLNYTLRRLIKFVSARLFHMPSPAPHQIPFSKLRYFAPVHDYETYQFDSLNGYKTLFGILQEQGITYRYIGYPLIMSDRDVYQNSLESMKAHQLTVSFFSELDAIEHWNGKDSPQVNKKLVELTDYVNNLVTLFENSNPGGNVIIFSDHGMISVEKTIKLESKIKNIGLRDGSDYLSFYDATMARFWFFNEESKRKIIEKLNIIKEGRILGNTELTQAGLNFTDRAYGDLIFATKPGVMISPNYFQGKKRFREVHGHCPPSRDEYGFFLSNKQMTRSSEIRMENLFKLMLKILDIRVGNEK